MEYETLLVDIRPEEQCAVIKLNRPQVLNAINLQLIEELSQVLDEAEKNPDIRSLIITGNHPYAFCGGADSHALIHDYTKEDRQNFMKAMEALYWKMTNLPKPIIGAINGYAIGGGAQLAVSCDIRVGTSRTNIQFAGATYGLIVGSWQLAAIVGPSRAQELLITARFVKGEEAAKIGLLHFLYDGTELEYRCLQLANQIRQNSANGVEAAKFAAWKAFGSTLEEAYLHEVHHNLEYITYDEFVIGLQRSVDSRGKNKK